MLVHFAQAVPQSPFSWSLDHVHTVTWPILTWFAVKTCVKIMSFINQMEQRFEKPIEQVNHMSTNCFPTMQTSLQNIDTNIKILVDRG